MANYKFIPAYYEWHLVNENGDIMLSMSDPLDSLYNETDIDGNLLDEPEFFTSLDEVLDMCREFIEVEKKCLESDFPDSTQQGNNERIFELPDNAADIMAQALYDYYIAA